jgi:hypothetical protein
MLPWHVISIQINMSRLAQPEQQYPLLRARKQQAVYPAFFAQRTSFFTLKAMHAQRLVCYCLGLVEQS